MDLVTKTCFRCQSSFDVPAKGKGRHRKYCSSKCISDLKKERTYATRLSASAIKRAENSTKPKPLIHYDREGDFRELQDRRETKVYSIEILTIIKKAQGNWVSAPSIRRQLDPVKIRMWEAAIGLLVDDIEVKNPLIPHYRYSVRQVKPPQSRHEANSDLFGKRHKPRGAFPTEAIAEEYR